jgi:hypothetical protein
MILALLEVVVLVAIVVYVEWWRAGQRRRQALVWDRLVAQLRPNWHGDGLSDQLNNQFIWHPDQSATPEQRWLQVQGAAGLWAMYENARVMLDMANYAARNCANVDEVLLTELRKDAMEIRICVLIALTKYASSHVTEGTCANVSRAASIYADMAGRMAELMRAYGEPVASDYVGVS